MPSCTLNGNRIVSLDRLRQYIHLLTEHSASCGVPLSFLGESSRHRLASVFVSQCPKCHSIIRSDISSMMTYNNNSHYTTNVQAVLGQVATGGGGEHLEEQLACLQIPSVTKGTFIQLELVMCNISILYRYRGIFALIVPYRNQYCICLC